MSKLIDRVILIGEACKILQEVDIFSIEEYRWLELTINNTFNGKDGLVSCRNLINECKTYLDARSGLIPGPPLTLWDESIWQQKILQMLDACKAIYYRQKTVLVGVPQRKKYQNFLAPNLFGFVAPQSCRIDVDACYGLGYCESRQYFVTKALNDNIFTHIMFVDDDILLPLNAIDILLSYNEPFIGASYVKKNVLIESTATTIIADPKWIYTNSAIPCTQNDLQPVKVSALGLGATLIDLDVFRKMAYPYFEFQFDKKGKVLVGEDSLLVQKALAHGFSPKIIPGLVAAHVNFATGEYFGPEWLVDPEKRILLPKYKDLYCKFACDPKQLYSPDIDKVFQNRG